MNSLVERTTGGRPDSERVGSIGSWGHEGIDEEPVTRTCKGHDKLGKEDDNIQLEEHLMAHVATRPAWVAELPGYQINLEELARPA